MQRGSQSVSPVVSGGCRCRPFGANVKLEFTKPVFIGGIRAVRSHRIQRSNRRVAMSFGSLVRGFTAATLLAATVAVAPAPAAAQDLISFLWGGSDEWGGGRQTVRFSPSYKPGQVIVSFGDRRLYLVTRPGEAISYPIAVPREQSRWSGVTSVSDKRANPDWRPTPTMRAENPKLPNFVPGGHPQNPLGVRALYLGSSMYRIHGTDAPWTIGQAVSKGCIRMYNADVLDLYPRVALGTRVTVTWQRFTAGPALASWDSAEPEQRVSRRSQQRPRAPLRRDQSAWYD